MRNSARPKVRAQIHPRALQIVDLFFKIREGYDDFGTPHFRGIPEHIWHKMHRENPKLFKELVEILASDYPTFAALVQKIWAKKVGHLLPLIFNRTQLLAWDVIAGCIVKREPIFLVILKARQLGMSTLINGWCHWHVWRLRDIEALLVADEKKLVYSFVDRLRIFHEELPDVPGIKRTLRVQAKNARVPKDELYYNETRSKVSTEVAKTTETHGRSTIHNHLAEFAFYPDASTLLGALMPQLPQAGSPARLLCSMIIESTPNGKNDFYLQWKIAKDPISDWKALFYPWMVAEDEYYLTPPPGWKMTDERREWADNLAHVRKAIDGVGVISPGQVFWYEQTLENEAGGDQDKMDALYPSDDETCFLLRSRSIFKHDMRYLQATVTEAERRAPQEFKRRGIICKRSYLRGYLEYTPPPSPFGGKPPSIEQLRLRPKFVESPDGPLVLWAPPFDGHAYVAGIDSASGLMESDNSVVCLLDVTEGRQVGEYAGRIAPEKLADDSCALGYFYNTALLYPEINSIGVVTMKRLKQVWQYPRVGREEKWDEVGFKDNKYGHYTTHEQKVIMVSFLCHVVRNRFLAISSSELLAEMSTFIQTTGRDGDGTEKFEADANNHDDRVDALMLACFCIRQSPRLLVQFTQQRVHLPTAVESGIHDAPTPPTTLALDSLPEDVRKIILGAEVLAVPSNPIRGELEVLI